MMSKMHMDRMKQSQRIDDNELDTFNQYLQRDVQQHLPLNQSNSLSYSKIKVNMPVIAEHQNETPEETRPTYVQPSQRVTQFSKGDQIKLHIRVVFKFYATFGNRTNTRFLKSNKFLKLLSDALLMPQLLSQKDADIIYSQFTRNNEILTLEQFQQLLPRLAMLIFPQTNASQALLKLYQDYLMGLAQKILQFTEFGQQMTFILRPIDQQFGDIVRPISQQLEKLHHFIFNDQSKNISRVQWQFVQFLTQCELIPNYINQSQAQLIFDNIQIRQPILNLPDNPNYLLGVNHFVESLILISSTIPNLDEISQFRVILDKIEQSEGFNKYLRALNRTQSDQVRLYSNIEKSRVSNTKQSAIMMPGKLTETSLMQSRVGSTSNMKQSMTVCVNVQQEYIPIIKKLFDNYSQIGESSNFQSLKNTKFNKLLLHCNILNNHINSIDADMIYAKLTGQKWIKSQQINNQACNGKMIFSQFLMALKMVADKCQIELEQLVTEYLIPLEKDISEQSNNSILQILVELLQDEEIIELYKTLQPIFDLYFDEFAQQASMLMLTDFMKFCMDFELSNILISQTKLISVFYAVASLNQQQDNYKEFVYIDKSQFVEAISILAVLIYQSVPEYMQRIVYFLERIFQSQRAHKIHAKQNKFQNRFYHLIDEIKANYMQSQQQNQVNCNFDDMIKEFQ